MKIQEIIQHGATMLHFRFGNNTLAQFWNLFTTTRAFNE